MAGAARLGGASGLTLGINAGIPRGPLAGTTRHMAGATRLGGISRGPLTGATSLGGTSGPLTGATSLGGTSRPLTGATSLGGTSGGQA